MSITYSECVFVALGIQHSSACAILSSVACSALQYIFFSTLSHKGTPLEKKVTEHKMYVLIFSTTFVPNIFHSKKN